MASFRDFLPFTDGRPRKDSKKQAVALVDAKTSKKVYKIASLAQGSAGNSSFTPIKSRNVFESAPYDLDRIIQAIDTDSYVKQGFNKYKELIWKEGWTLVSENVDAAEYLRHRFDVMEFAMRKPMQEVFVEISDQIVKFANAFVAKAYGDIRPYMKTPVEPVNSGKKDPVAGYYAVPAETMQIQRDQNNVPLKYKQALNNGMIISSSSVTDDNYPQWDPDEMIHFAFDKKPGRIFGTPFIVGVLDDVIALRQIEQDIQNLVHRELFPLYVYQIGTEEDPATPEEIDNAESELAALRSEGGLIVPERHNITVLGAENNALSADPYLRYFQERVIVGLGLAPHHLGVMNAGGNRSVTDRLDIALYDKVKTYQRYLSEVFRLLMINELLLEGGFDPISTPEDRVYFKFNEIDVDTQIKKDAAVIQKWQANLIDQDEGRMHMGEDPDVDESKLLIALTARMTPDTISTTKTASGDTKPVTVDTTPAAATSQPKPGGDGAKPSTGGIPNQPNKLNRQIGNKVRPQNQHGRQTSPHVRHMDDTLLDEITELLD